MFIVLTFQITELCITEFLLFTLTPFVNVDFVKIVDLPPAKLCDKD